jgi:hypothetical protein
MSDRVHERDSSAALDEEASSDDTRAPERDRAGGFLRHPLVVGAMVAAIGGILANVLIRAASARGRKGRGSSRSRGIWSSG